MNANITFALQFLSSFYFTLLIVRWHISSKLYASDLRVLLLPLVSVHVLRTIGMIYTTPGILGIDVSLPKLFLYTTAYGDLFTALLAVITLNLLIQKKNSYYVWVWIFNVVGFVDLIFALGHGVHIKFLSYNVGLAWFLPAYVVPALLVTHFAIFYLLIKKKNIR
jgi:hypothetical protein